jgi:cellulose synthase/poly-beta-1,6-N-acetylglucosamine synthase-like glycosyltransferase
MQRAEKRDWLGESETLPGNENLHHLVLIPTYGESEEILADTLHHLALQDVDRNRLFVVLAFEERDAVAPARASRLTQRFGPLFGELLVTFHPDLPNEVKGKSSNLAWACRRVEEELVDSGRVRAEDLVVTVCDADSRLHHRYLSALGVHTLSDPESRFHLFQPAILFYANHWRLPAPMRVMNSIYSLYELARMIRTYRLVTQSTYSMKWTTARDVGFWDVDVIPEDSHMFFKVFFHLGARVKTRPIFLPVYADAAEGPTLWRTLANHYQQIRRWAWGVSDVPYVVLGAIKSRNAPWHQRFLRVFWYLEEHLVWPSHWFLLTLGGVLPPLLNPAIASSTQWQFQQTLVSAILTVAGPCLIVVLLADWRLRPSHPSGEDAFEAITGWIAFLFLPLVSLPLSTLPALDAHTRLLFGRYLEYRVTEKVPVKARFRGAAEVRSADLVAVDQGRQQRPYPLRGSTPVADSVLGVVRDLS